MALWNRYASVAYLAVLVGTIGHASSEFVSVLSGVSGPELSVWRFMLGSAGLIIISLILYGSKNLIEPLKSDGLKLIGLSLIGVTLCYLMFHWSLDFATVPQVATTTTTTPIFVGIMNLWLNKQPFTRTKIISGLCALLGVALLITDGYLLKLAGSGRTLIGVLMALSCTFSMAVYLVMARPIITKYGALRISALTLGIGTIGLWLVVGSFWNVWVNPLTLFARPASQAASLLTIGIWNTTITQFLWIGGLAAVPDITRGSYIFYLKPVIATGLAVWVLSQPVTGWQSLAIMIICGSVAVEAFWGRGLGKKS